MQCINLSLFYSHDIKCFIVIIKEPYYLKKI